MPELDTPYIDLLLAIISLVILILFFLYHRLEENKYKINLEIDLQILNMKALDLLRKLPSQFPGPTIAYPLTNFTNDKLKKVKQSPYTESLDIDVKLADDVIRIIENFKSRFLTEPHEKSG